MWRGSRTVAPLLENAVNARETYLKFLRLAHQTDTAQRLNPEDSVCEKLLELIALAEDQKTPLTVTQALRFDRLASPSTLHRKLHDLLQAGYILQEQHGADRRTRYLHLTEKSQTLFARMGQCLVHSTLEAA